MAIPVLQACVGVGVLWAVWWFIRPYVTRSPLDNIPGPPSPSLLKGNIPELLDPRNAWTFHKMLAERYGSVVRLTELFGKRALYVFDPKALHSIIVKEQYTYDLPRWQMARRMLLLGPGLISTTGEQHRLQRKSLNPVFSIAHMRYLTPIFYDIGHKLRNAIAADIKQKSTSEVDMVVWMGRAALELVGQGGLGYSFDKFEGVMENTYGYALRMFQVIQTQNRIFMFLATYAYMLPSWLRGVCSRYVPDAGIQRMRKIADAMDFHSRKIFKEKKDGLSRGEDAVVQQVGRGKDIMSILLKANVEASEDDKLPEEEVLAQMSTFVLAGTDTTSSALARILDILSHRPEVQEKLRQEIVEARNGHDISYDALVNLPYLDAVCRETLRLYNPVSIIFREATEDTILPLSTPICGLDGTMMNEVFVPRGTTVFVGNLSSNINKSLWGDDAEEWKPERWLAPLPEALKEAHLPGVYANLMTFSGGSRSCIGFKFSQLEMKVVLSVLLESFRFTPSDKPIIWNYSNISFPSVKGKDSAVSLPVNVEVL